MNYLPIGLKLPFEECRKKVCSKEDGYFSPKIFISSNIPKHVLYQYEDYTIEDLNEKLFKNDRKEIIKYLLQAGADVNSKDNIEWTSLHYASFYGHKEIVEILEQHM